MRVVQSPEEYKPKAGEWSVFLAGGISNCHDWQKELIEFLKDTDLVLINPRREDFDPTNRDMERAQIEWEYRHLQMCTAYSFWFPPETLCPITLFELGDALNKKRPIFIGCHPDYKRIRDVKIQVELRLPYPYNLITIPCVSESIEVLANKIKKWDRM